MTGRDFNKLGRSGCGRTISKGKAHVSLVLGACNIVGNCSLRQSVQPIQQVPSA